jgi:hypothetical protein
MDIDDGDNKNTVIQDSEDGGGNMDAKTGGSGGRRRDRLRRPTARASTPPQVEAARTYKLAKCRGNEG